jgi:hypothetical protein
MTTKLPEGPMPRCPVCGSNNVAWILYSPVEMNDELAMMIQTKKIVLRPAVPREQDILLPSLRLHLVAAAMDSLFQFVTKSSCEH